MLPAHPPHSRRISPIWNDTDSTCVSPGRMCRAKRSGKTMIVSIASEPQISTRGGPLRPGPESAVIARSAARVWQRSEISWLARPLAAVGAAAADLAHDVLLPARDGKRLG